jgi:uncharacterized DUF497 family protein
MGSGLRMPSAFSLIPTRLSLSTKRTRTESEVRYGMIGLIALGMVYVCFTERSGDRVRIIHARRAEPWMVEEYEKQGKRI